MFGESGAEFHEKKKIASLKFKQGIGLTISASTTSGNGNISLSEDEWIPLSTSKVQLSYLL